MGVVFGILVQERRGSDDKAAASIIVGELASANTSTGTADVAPQVL
jgi:hypothetical protein